MLDGDFARDHHIVYKHLIKFLRVKERDADLQAWGRLPEVERAELKLFLGATREYVPQVQSVLSHRFGDPPKHLLNTLTIEHDFKQLVNMAESLTGTSSQKEAAATQFQRMVELRERLRSIPEQLECLRLIVQSFLDASHAGARHRPRKVLRRLITYLQVTDADWVLGDGESETKVSDLRCLCNSVASFISPNGELFVEDREISSILNAHRS